MSAFRIKIDEPKLLSEDIADSIKTAIIKGKFKPGEKISEGELAESMGISRTPLREAFRKLENEGFIRIIPRKGAVVAKIDAEEAISMIINGFCKDVFTQLPMEFAVEATKLLGLKLEGSVG